MKALLKNTFKTHLKHISNKAFSKVIQQATKSPYITMDEKGANTFPFITYPPNSRKISKGLSYSFHPFLYWIKEKSMATLDICNTCDKMKKHPSQFSHRITVQSTFHSTTMKGRTPSTILSPTLLFKLPMFLEILRVPLNRYIILLVV